MTPGAIAQSGGWHELRRGAHRDHHGGDPERDDQPAHQRGAHLGPAQRRGQPQRRRGPRLVPPRHHASACNDSFGTRVHGGSAPGRGIAQVASREQATTLTAGTRYYVCAISNAIGTGYGEVLTFVAGGLPPVVTTEAAMDILATSATMAGTTQRHTAWFRFGDRHLQRFRVPKPTAWLWARFRSRRLLAAPVANPLEPATTYF